MLLLIDNHDSFTYNLADYFKSLGQNVCVRYENELSIEDIETLSPDYLVISPGPGRPRKDSICYQAILQFYKKLPILGVCLGHQYLAYAFGANIIKAHKIMHGKVSSIEHWDEKPFQNLPKTFNVARYHSLVIEEKTLSDDFIVTARTKEQTIMAIAHTDYPSYGIQFHPEAILSEHGHAVLNNFLMHHQ